ncbi:hypothetical protein BB558_001524 [Smittium angustum]|uniref:OBG-type G domain-containing protein n=1 Tax=Smittium angustum TaxID=133377 RepID=A0A2U1JBC2_SMIAN|nr:hypothetical protein BB558_001524 [Smittium angustum]
MSDFVVACVGKPSAGKSSFLNAVTNATAKVGNYPFTTIDPNQGIAYYPTECPCKKYNRPDICKPRHGWCENGIRYVPIKLLDVAGLVPGASEGRGLGNKFLDDLRHADILIHVVDGSGLTDENGKETKGYNLINDIMWLRNEIHAWIFNNLSKKWDSVVRRHLATKSTSVATLQAQLSGYGSTKDIVMSSINSDLMKISLNQWTLDDLSTFVFDFIDERFPTIIDGINADQIVLTSAISECYLRLMDKQKFIKYTPGEEDFYTINDDPSLTNELKPYGPDIEEELEKIRDLVLFRYFGTGTQQAIIKAVETLNMIPVYPVKSVSGFSVINQNTPLVDNTGVVRENSKTLLRDCVLVKSGTTVRQLAKRLHDELDRNFNGAETIGNVQLGENDVIVAGKNNIICIKTKYSPPKSTAGSNASKIANKT